MSVKVFALKDVPEDEADEVRALLEAHQLTFFETPAGNWGISAPAIWIDDAQHAARARSLIETYQQERMQRVQAEYEQLKQQGSQRTWMDVIRDNPVRFVAYVAVIALVLYFSTKPYLDFGK
jgi:nitrogenase molybdenum-iron protein alpha/beta subunit